MSAWSRRCCAAAMRGSSGGRAVTRGAFVDANSTGGGFAAILTSNAEGGEPVAQDGSPERRVTHQGGNFVDGSGKTA